MVDNSANNKRIAKNTMFMYFRMALVMVVSLYTVRVILQALGIEDYGIYSAVGGIITSLSFISSVLALASQRFFAIEIGKNDTVRLSKVFNMIVLLYLIIGCLIVLLGETIGNWFLLNKMIIPENRIAAAIWVLQCTIVSFIISILASPFQALIIAYEKMNIYAFIGIVEVVLKLIIASSIQCFHTDKLVLYSFLLIASTALINLFYLVYCCKSFRGIRLNLRWDKSIFRDVTSFSGWSLFGSLSFICNTQGLNLLLNAYFGPVVNAAYLVGNQVKSAINQFSTNFYVAVRPSLIKEYSIGNLNYVHTLFCFSTKTIFVMLFIIAFPISSQAEGILKIWLSEVGDYMVVFVRLMLIYAVVLSLSDPITTIIQAANRVKQYHLIVDGFTLLTLPLTFVAFRYGMEPIWAFIVSIVVFAIAHIFRLVLLKEITGFTLKDYFVNIVLRILAAIVIVCAFSTSLKLLLNNQSVTFMFIKLIIEFMISLIACWFLVLNKVERVKIKEIVQTKIRRH